MVLDLVGWVVIGLIVGFVAGKFVDLRGDDPQLDLIAGVIGAKAGEIVVRRDGRPTGLSHPKWVSRFRTWRSQGR